MAKKLFTKNKITPVSNKPNCEECKLIVTGKQIGRAHV